MPYQHRLPPRNKRRMRHHLSLERPPLCPSCGSTGRRSMIAGMVCCGECGHVYRDPPLLGG